MTLIASAMPPAHTPANERVDCAHCGLCVPAGLIEPGASKQFCCHACATAHSIITGSGLEGYYALSRLGRVAPARATGTGNRYHELDDPQFARVFCRPGTAPGLVRAELALQGVRCAACVWLLERVPRLIPGVRQTRVRLTGGTIDVEYDPGVTPLSAIARLIDSLGYAVHPAHNAHSRARRQVEDRGHLIRIGIAGALAGNLMMLALPLYGGFFASIEPGHQQLFRVISCVLGVISLGGPGKPLFVSAWASLRARMLNLDAPICLALLAGGVMGVVNTVANRGEIYFDSLGMLVFLLLCGRFVQQRQNRWASDSVELLLNLAPNTARVVRGAEIAEVASMTLTPGDLIEVRAGECLPADGTVELGESSVDQSLLTGESRPVSVGVGGAVCAGTLNIRSLLRVRVSAAGMDTRAGRLMAMVADAGSRKPPIIRFTDRVASMFTLGVTALAGITALVWLQINPGVAIDHATSMLIVTCPCALGIAAPLVMGVGIGRGARRGVLIKGADVLESLSTPGTIVLDKTGTVTRGRLGVVACAMSDHTLGVCAGLESGSSHRAARAIVDYAHARGVTPKPCASAVTLRDGVRGRVDGAECLIGSLGLHERHTVLDTPTRRSCDAMIARGLSPVLLSIDARVAGVLGLGDPLRDDSREAVDELRRRGWRVRLLSGDHPVIVAQTAAALGMQPNEARGGVSPEEKLAAIIALRSGGRVVMVGDGVNDAAALAGADVGIAVHGGAEASLTAADVYLARPGLGPILELLDASNGAMAAVRRTLGASLAYNLLAGAITLLGLIHPIIAAIMMPVSSLTMLGIALLSRTFPTTPASDAGEVRA